jgi:tetratricopeptide (TPR) repeat protein
MNQAIETESSDPLRCFIAGNSGDGKSVHGRVSLDPKPLTKDGESDSEIEVVSADTFDKSEALTVSNEPSGEQDAGSPADSSPEACEAYYQLGVTYREMGMLDGAIAEFRRSSLDARLALRARTMVGLCLLAKGDAEAAIDELSRALSILGRPPKEYQAAKYDLATAYQAIGILNAALAILRCLQKESPALRDMEHRVLKLKGHLTHIAGFSETPNRSSDPIDRPEAVGT